MALSQEELTAAQIEKRQYRRAKLVAEVHCEALGRESVAVTRDVSVGGMFLSHPAPFPAHSQVSLNFRLHAGAPPLSCRGEVAYAIGGVGMGVRFTELSEDARAAIERFVAEAN